jgi:FixJ family two-component response regulator
MSSRTRPLCVHERQATVLDRLTLRECKMLELIAEGRSNSALAQHLSIAERAVEKARLGHLHRARPAAAAGAPPSCAR